MAHYTILIDYTTGGSFGSERIYEEELGIVTESLISAKENLKRIKLHYENFNDSMDFDARYELELLTDDGSRTICPFWIGYFEVLHGAKIVQEDPDMSFEL